jgi:hypothetical protein
MDPVLVGAIAFAFVDWSQTRTIADEPARHFEANPILGKHPSIGAVNTYFLASVAVHTTLHYTLPGRWSKYHDVFWVGMEAACVGKNIHAGIRMTF